MGSSRRRILETTVAGVSGATLASVDFNGGGEETKVKGSGAPVDTDVEVSGDIDYNTSGGPSEVKMVDSDLVDLGDNAFAKFTLDGSNYNDSVKISTHFVFEEDGELKEAQSGMWQLNFNVSDEHNINTRLNFADVDAKQINVKEVKVIHHSL